MHLFFTLHCFYNFAIYKVPYYVPPYHAVNNMNMQSKLHITGMILTILYDHYREAAECSITLCIIASDVLHTTTGVPCGIFQPVCTCAYTLYIHEHVSVPVYTVHLYIFH